MKKLLASLFEKTVTTYLQVFVTGLLAANYLDISVLQAAAVAAVPASLTVIANGLPQPDNLPFAGDLAFRTIRTYVVSFVGLMIAVPVFSLSIDAAQAAALGAIPAALAVVKSGLASRVGNVDTAALLPFGLDPSTITPSPDGALDLSPEA
jgi:hypothetical protein